jgi:hypothetical protein
LLEQGADLRARIQISSGELLHQLRLERGAALGPLRPESFGRIDVEKHARRGNFSADRRDAVLELERLPAVAVRLQELPELLADQRVADAALLHLRRPLRPIRDVGADLRHTEAKAPSFDAIATAQLSHWRVAHGRGLIVKIADVWQDQSAGDQRIDDGAAGLRRPAVQLVQQPKVIIEDIVPDQIVGAGQMLEPGGDLLGAMLVDPIAIEIGDADAVQPGRGI